jgi:hypothetical protein
MEWSINKETLQTKIKWNMKALEFIIKFMENVFLQLKNRNLYESYFSYVKKNKQGKMVYCNGDI